MGHAASVAWHLHEREARRVSTIAEMARREAERAEAEDDTPDTGEPVEPDDGDSGSGDPGAPDGEPGEPAPDAEAIQRAVEKAHTTYEKALAKIDGLAFDQMVECDRCGSMGYHPPQVLVLPEPKPAPDRETCPDCDGLGQVLSGAKNELHYLEQCNRCNGNGWVSKARDAQYTPPPNGAPGALAMTPGAPDPYGTPSPSTMPLDAWQRPFGHPHYGVPPAAISG